MRNITQTEKDKSLWRLHREESNQSVLVWRKHVRKRRRIGNGKRMNQSYFETITWKRSNDLSLFTTRSAPRTPPVAMSVPSAHKKTYKSDSAKRPCACGHPNCNDIAKLIAQHYDYGDMQTKLIRHTRGPYRQHLFSDQPARIRKKRDKESAAGQHLQSILNTARTESINLLRKGNAVKALRGSALESAMFNVACHYPVSFVKVNQRNTMCMMSTSLEEWGVTPFQEFQPSLDAVPQALCVPQLECDNADTRWAVVSSSSEQESSDDPPPDPPSVPPTLVFNDNITYKDMDGDVQPANWSGSCKYNYMNPAKYEADPRMCKRNFGYPGTFVELIIRITQVWFPFVEAKRSSMKESAKLTQLEESLATLYYFKHASPSCDQVNLQKTWGLSKQQFVRLCV